jgi:hypothetical protein
MARPRVLGSIANGTSPDRDPRDFYQTPQGFTRELLRREQFHSHVWEPAAGAGAISGVLAAEGYDVFASDIHPMAEGITEGDFFELAAEGWDIVTNPPFKLMAPFIERAFELCHRKLAVVMPLGGLGSGGRHSRLWSKLPVARIYHAPLRQRVRSRRGLEPPSQFDHIWVVFDKQHRGDPAYRWFPAIAYESE